MKTQQTETLEQIPEMCRADLCDVLHDQICRNCWARMDGDMDCAFIVRMKSPMQPAVSFHSNVSFAKIYCVVVDAEANQFTSVSAAREAMREYGLPASQATICRIAKGS